MLIASDSYFNGFVAHFMSPDGGCRAKAKLTKPQRTASHAPQPGSIGAALAAVMCFSWVSSK